MKYVWLVEGEPYTGTLQDYAEDVEQAHYSDVEVSSQVWYLVHDVGFSAPRFAPTEPLVAYRATCDDIQTVVLNVGVDEGRYRIDLRA